MVGSSGGGGASGGKGGGGGKGGTAISGQRQSKHQDL